MRFLITSTALLALAACGTSIPDEGPNTGSGAGFGNYNDYQAQRDAQLEGSDTDDIAAQTRLALGADPEDLAGNSGVPIVHAGPGNPAPQLTNSPGISAENNFDAVSSRRSIEDDAARVAAQQQQYQIAAVEALPSRSGSTGPNIVEYALRTKHAPGTALYKRGSLMSSQSKHERNCAAYSGPDLAQIDFLSKGGPERDRLQLDPDGDGFACSWDPRPFRSAAGS